MKMADKMLQPATSQRTGVKSAVRTVEIIEYFTKVTQPARTSEISENLGFPNSSTDEILRTLADLGYLTFNRQSKRYAPSYKLVGIMRAIECGFFGGDRLRQLLKDLQAETGCSVHMTVQNDCWLESVAQVPGSWSEPTGADIYSPWQLIQFNEEGWQPGTNFAGALLTLHSNGAIIDLAVRTQAMGIAPKGKYVMHDLIERVHRIRSRGFSVCRRDDEIKVDSIACPMRIPGGNMPVAVGVLGHNLLDSEQSARKLAMMMMRVIAHHSYHWTGAAA
jgi:DNA-binding IclR family transcriptional regulator